MAVGQESVLCKCTYICSFIRPNGIITVKELQTTVLESFSLLTTCFHCNPDWLQQQSIVKQPRGTEQLATGQ